MFPFKKIAVATDFGAASRHALDVAADLARRYGAELVVVHAVEPIMAPYPIAIVPDQTTLDAAAENELDEEAARAQALLPATTHQLLSGSAPSAIGDFVQDQGVDLLVVGTHGRRGPSRWLIGSVAERIIRSVRVPVLTVRADG